MTHATHRTNLPAAAAGTVDIGDLSVNRMGFGAMRLTGDGIWGEPADRAECRAVLRRAIDLGVDFIDTADSYGPEVSERLIAEALHPYPEGLVIATKAGFDRPGPGRWRQNGRPGHLRSACEGSLRRLRLERIDLFQLHRIDPDVPAEDQFGTLARLQEEGKIRHIGLSEVSVADIQLARQSLDIVAVQNRYSLRERKWDDVVDYCAGEGLAFLPWRPIMDELDDESIGDVAREHDASPAQVALAWLLARSPAMLVIPGTSRVAHLDEDIAAAALELHDQDLDRLG